MLPIPVGVHVSVVLFNFTSKGLDISNDSDLLECFLNLPSYDIAENNPIDFEWIQTQQNIGTELATKAAKNPQTILQSLDTMENIIN